MGINISQLILLVMELELLWKRSSGLARCNVLKNGYQGNYFRIIG